MRLRVLQRYQAVGADDDALALLDTCLTAALAARERALPEHDARFLHPARTVLILLDDANMIDPVALAAGALLDSDDPAWRGGGVLDPRADGVGPDDLRTACRTALALCEAVPVPADAEEDEGRLLEELVASPPDVRLLACAERLDLARHIHMVATPDPRRWLRQVTEVYAPVAWRTAPLLARRLERWAGACGSRLDSA
jgi:hypothetical protein